ncbi:MAG TPA: sigma-70 family RNA polymerase sigma factor [Anaeromyxobacteraceae bacterium]|nr:sigma-70 family RNA polymerase sigma factor [Anaeromyxobacteraceae bacterium]
MGPADAELVARVVAADDRRAFAVIVRRHQSAVRSLLRRLCAGDAARADDLAQETFLRAYRRLSTWRGEARLSTWLHRIAFRLWASEARRRAAPEPPPPEGPPPLEDLALARHDLARAFALLRDEERAALALAYAEDLTHEEAAGILGVPLGTLKTHVLRGKERLRRLLSPAREALP